MGEKPKILVIDDSAETVAGLHSFFDNKYEVLTADIRHHQVGDHQINIRIVFFNML